MVPEAYPLHVPKGTADALVVAFQRIPANHLDAWRMHRVNAGETLAVIGKRYNVQPSNIVAGEHPEFRQPHGGGRGLIPPPPRPRTPVAEGPPGPPPPPPPAAPPGAPAH